MKKILLLFALPALIFASCSDNDEDELNPRQSLSASTPKLTFPTEGDALTFELTASNVDWKVTPSDEWIEWKETSKKAGNDETTVHTIEVTLGKGPADGRDGKLTITASGVPDVAVEIVQLAEQILSANIDEMIFPANGDAIVFELSSKNVDWEITPSANWIEFKETESVDTDNGITIHYIEVTVGEGPEDGREGEIKISAEGVEEVIITIIQEESGPKEFYWETNSLTRMNLHGNVQTAGLHNNFVHDNYMADLVFDGEGWLTNFVHTTRQDEKVSNKVSYNEDRRISKLEGTFVNGQFCSAEFTYGNDSRYIPMEEIFYFIMLDVNADLMAWFPQFVRGLEKISVRSFDGFTYDFFINPDAGTVIQRYDGAEDYTFIWDMTFNGNFPTSLMADNWGDVKVIINLDSESGKLISYRTEDDWGWSERTHQLNASNSPAQLRTHWQELDYKYNDNFDLISVEDILSPSGSRSFTYPAFDQAGNWTAMTESGGSSYNRTVTYWGN